MVKKELSIGEPTFKKINKKYRQSPINPLLSSAFCKEIETIKDGQKRGRDETISLTSTVDQ